MRLRATAATRVSRIERSEADAAALAAAGPRTVVLDLSGHVFFGSANRILERIRSECDSTPRPARIVVNFDRVDGIDASAAQSLMRVVLECREQGIRPVFTGLRGACEAQYVRAAAPDALADRYPTLEAALEAIEDEELALVETGAGGESGLIAAARTLVAEGWAEETAFAAEETLLELGAASHEIYVLTEGACRAEVPGRDGARYLVARFLPGALIGEIASYTGSVRTAWVVADSPGRAIRIDATALPDTSAKAAQFHRAAARSLSRRVQRMTRLDRVVYDNVSCHYI